jgi:hypothetical protein
VLEGGIELLCCYTTSHCCVLFWSSCAAVWIILLFWNCWCLLPTSFSYVPCSSSQLTQKGHVMSPRGVGFCQVGWQTQKIVHVSVMKWTIYFWSFELLIFFKRKMLTTHYQLTCFRLSKTERDCVSRLCFEITRQVTNKPVIYNIFSPIDSVFSLPSASFQNNSYWDSAFCFGIPENVEESSREDTFSLSRWTW